MTDFGLESNVIFAEWAADTPTGIIRFTRNHPTIEGMMQIVQKDKTGRTVIKGVELSDDSRLEGNRLRAAIASVEDQWSGQI